MIQDYLVRCIVETHTKAYEHVIITSAYQTKREFPNPLQTTQIPAHDVTPFNYSKANLGLCVSKKLELAQLE